MLSQDETRKLVSSIVDVIVTLYGAEFAVDYRIEPTQMGSPIIGIRLVDDDVFIGARHSSLYSPKEMAMYFIGVMEGMENAKQLGT